MYGDLFECFGFQRLIQRIMANTPLEVPRRFDLVVAQMATFCTHRNPVAPVAWQWPDWQFFLRDLIENVVAPRFEMFFEINRAYLPQAVADALTARGASVDLKDCIIRINDAQTDAILAR
jgi:hypothetical protein